MSSIEVESRRNIAANLKTLSNKASTLVIRMPSGREWFTSNHHFTQEIDDINNGLSKIRYDLQQIFVRFDVLCAAAEEAMRLAPSYSVVDKDSKPSSGNNTNKEQRTKDSK
jgi:hypothetical protein